MADFGIVSKHESIHNKRKSEDNSIILNRIKYLIIFTYLFGTNRLYLFKWKTVFIVLSYLYSLVLLLIASYFIFLNSYVGSRLLTFSHVILGLEHILLIITLILNKSKLEHFYRDLSKIDETLNIVNNDTALSDPLKITWWLITISSLSEFFKYSLSFLVESISGVRYDWAFKLSLNISIFFYMTRNIEQIFYKFNFSLLLIRLKIIKAHILKKYNVDNNWCEEKNLDKVEMLHKRAEIDIETLHKMYEMLYKCWLRWNSVCSTPLIIILCTNALSTILAVVLIVLKVFAIALPGNENSTLPSGFQIRALYQTMVGVKCFLLTLIPCYYASATRTQVSVIHSTLSDAFHQKNLDAVEKLRVEAFLELTKDSTFCFSLMSIIKVDMFLPLRYLNFCLTYVIITINFAKFIK